MAFSNVGFILKRMKKNADAMVFFHNAAYLFESISKKREELPKLDSILYYLVQNGLNLRFSDAYFVDEGQLTGGVPFSDDMKSPLKLIDLYHHYLYLDLSSILRAVELKDEAAFAEDQAEYILSVARGRAWEAPEEFLKKKGKKNQKEQKEDAKILIVEPQGKPVCGVTIEGAAFSWMYPYNYQKELQNEEKEFPINESEQLLYKRVWYAYDNLAR